MSDQVFVDDGYEEQAFIPAEPGIHGEIHFTFRPMTYDEVKRWARQVEECYKRQGNRETPELDKMGYETAAARIVSWDVTRANGTPVPVEAANFAKLKPAAFRKILEILTGRAPVYPDGLTSLDKLEADEKNSGAASG